MLAKTCKFKLNPTLYMKILKLVGAFLASSAALSQFALAEVFNLKNGDRISGEIVARGIDDVYLKTAFGTIKLPKDQVVSIEGLENEAKDKVLADNSSAQPEAVKSEPEKNEEDLTKAELDGNEGWVEAYKNFVHEHVPENWDFVFKGGLDYKNTSSKTISYTFAFDGHTAWDELNDFKFHAYYEYAAETPENGIKNSTVDKYGITTDYKRYFEVENTWYLTNGLSYGVDTIKGIKDQVDEMVGIGRTIKLLDEKMVINLAIGPAVRYINAYDYDNHWAALVTFNQDLAWDFHEYARLEQNFYLGENVLNVHQYNAVFGIGVVFKLSDVFNLTARYTYSYDAINSSEAQKTEQRILLGFEIPFK